MATNTIGKLVVSLGANSAQLVTELSKAKKQTNSWAKSAQSAAKFGAASFTAAAVAASVAAVGIIALVEANADAIDGMAKTADKLGITTEALQLLRYQGELSGVAMNTMDMAMQRMTRRVAEAAQGTGEAKGAIKELGLSAQELAQMSPDQQFYAISEAMKQIGSQGDRVRLAMKLFDSEGVALVNTMASDLGKVEEKFKSLGVAITREQAALVEGYSDAKLDLDYLFGSFSQKMTVYLSGPFTEAIKYIEEFGIEMGGMDGVARAVSVGVIDAFAGVVEAIAAITEALNDAELAKWAFFKGFEQQRGNFGSFLDQIGIDAGMDMMWDAHRNMQAIDELAGDVIDSQAKMAGRVDRLNKLAEDMRKAVNATPGANSTALASSPVDASSTEAITKNSQEYQKLIAQYDKGARVQLQYDQQVEKINAANITVAEKERLLTEALKERNKAVKELTSSQIEYNASVSKADGSLSKHVTGQNSEKVNSNFRDYSRAYQKSVDSGDSSGAAYFLKRLEEVFKGIALSGNSGMYDMGSMRQFMEQIKTEQNSAEIVNSQDRMVDVMTRLVDGITKLGDMLGGKGVGGTAGNGKDIGTIKMEIMADGKVLAGRLMGEPQFLSNLKRFIDQTTKETARAVAR